MDNREKWDEICPKNQKKVLKFCSKVNEVLKSAGNVR